jgi:hypothetical protein
MEKRDNSHLLVMGLLLVVAVAFSSFDETGFATRERGDYLPTDFEYILEIPDSPMEKSSRFYDDIVFVDPSNLVFSESIEPTSFIETPSIQKASTVYDYPVEIRGIYVYDGSISGHEALMKQRAIDNANSVATWYVDAISEFNTQLDADGYSPINIPISVTSVPTLPPLGYEKDELSILFPGGSPLVAVSMPGSTLPEATGFFHPFLDTFMGFFAYISKTDRMSIYVVDGMYGVDPNTLQTVFGPCGITAPTVGMMIISAQTSLSNGNLLGDLECYPSNKHSILMHELGHGGGLDHYYVNGDNLMSKFQYGGTTKWTVPRSIKMEHNQLMTLSAHLFGKPEKDLTFIGQTGGNFFNKHAGGSEFECENGMIGEDEECENGLKMVGDWCVNQLSNPPIVDNTHICLDDCTCKPFSPGGGDPVPNPVGPGAGTPGPGPTTLGTGGGGGSGCTKAEPGVGAGCSAEDCPENWEGKEQECITYNYGVGEPPVCRCVVMDYSS